MKSLHVAVVVKNKEVSFLREDKPVGYFSYAVDEFTWDYIPLSKGFQLDTRALAKQGYDFVFHIDGPLMGDYLNHIIPVVYYDIDSTLSLENHFQPRFEQSSKADLILVDHDQLERFAGTHKPVWRWSYCVNDKIFKDYGLPKDIDVSFHCNTGHAMPSQERSDMRKTLHDLCAKHGWTYASGMLPIGDYARSFSRSKVTVNVPRTPQNRPHRVFDALACRTCLLTAPLPDVSDEYREEGIHYKEFAPDDWLPLEHKISWLLGEDIGVERWKEFANDGYQLVREHHTWKTRAAELREIMQAQFGI